MPTRRVTATIPRYAGTGAVVIFKLSKVSAQLAPNQIQLTNDVRAPIDSQGRVCGPEGIELWCNIGGVLPALWTVKFPDGSKQAFNLPAGDTPIDLVELLAAEAVPWSPAIYPVIDAHIASHAAVLATGEHSGHMSAADRITLDTMGQAGPGADKNYAHSQGMPASVWGPINHGLGKFPAIDVVDSGGNQIWGYEVEYIDLNHVRLVHSAPFGGYAYFN